MKTSPPTITDEHQPSPARQWGWLPLLALTGAGGLFLVSLANFLSRAGREGGDGLFWSGLLLLTVPISLRLTSTQVLRRERVGLLLLLGLGLYLVKFLHSPFSFTFSDEFIHFYNNEMTLRTGQFFNPNPILAVTALYPGLASVTTALASLSGLPFFEAGLIIISAARLIMILSLYLLFEQVSRSPRSASLAILLYIGNANFLFWSAQFSYESLALPLALLVIFCAKRSENSGGRTQTIGLTLIAILGIWSVVVTHHLSSYFLAAFLGVWVLCLLCFPLLATVVEKLLRRRRGGTAIPRKGFAGLWDRSVGRFFRQLERFLHMGRAQRHVYRGPRLLALVALLSAALWVSLIANQTLNYLAPVFGRAYASLFEVMGGEGETRELFKSTSGYVAPIWERMTGLGSVLLCLLGLPFGLLALWRHHRHQMAAWLLGGMAVLYFATLALRLVPAAWETGNRASVFMFIGLAFTLALGSTTLLETRWAGKSGTGVFTGFAAIIFMGGIIAGWSPELRLGQPYQVAVGDQRIEPSGASVARWSYDALGPDHRMMADEVNGRYLMAYGQQFSRAGRYSGIKDLLLLDHVSEWMLEVFQREQIEYVLVDRRQISFNNMIGYYFDRTGGGPLPAEELFPPEIYEKFDRQANVSRILDAGYIVFYDVKELVNDASNIK